MATPQQLNPVPLGDQFSDLYAKFDENADLLITAASFAAGTLTLTRFDASTLTVPIPVGGDRILSGLTVSVAGVSPPFTLNVATGSWTIGGTVFTLGVPVATPLTNPDPTLDRIDAVFATSTGIIVYVVGVPAVTPSAPVPGAGQLLVAYISVPAASIPYVPPTLTLPPGVLDGQTLRWNAGSGAWVLNNDLISGLAGGSVMRTPNALAAFQVVQPSAILGRASMSSANSSTLDGSSVFLNAAVAQLYSTLDYTGSERLLLQLNGTAAFIGQSGGLANASLTLDFEEGIELTDYVNPPSVTTNKLYLENGVLTFDGDAVCLAPCGGGGLPPGTLNGDTLRWDTGLLDYVATSLLRQFDNGASASTFRTETLNGQGVMTMTQIGPTDATINLYTEDAASEERGATTYAPGGVQTTYNPLATSNPSEAAYALIDAAGVTLSSNIADTEVTIDTPNGLLLVDNGTPTTTVGRLYVDAGVLTFDGDAVCLAPCGGFVTQNVNVNAGGTTTITPSGGPNKIYVKVNAGSAATIQLPASPTANMEVVIKDTSGNAGTFNITIDRNGLLIDEQSLNAAINTDYGSLTFVYISDGLASTWMII